MKKIFKSIILVMMVFSTLALYALNANNGQNFTLYGDDDFKLGVGLEVSLLEGKSREYVYGSSSKLSELVWELDDVIMFGGVVSAEINDKIYINIGKWRDVDSSDGTLEDSDWLDPVTHIETHYSWHRTTLEKADQLDVNVAYTFWHYNGETVSSMSPGKSIDSSLTFQGIFGYKYDEYEWTAEGGYFLYGMNSPYYSFTTGTFSDVPVIEYEHDISVPYLGVSFNFNDGSFGVNGYALYSKWAKIDDEDQHLLRSLRFKDSFDGGRYNALGLNLKWDIGDSFTINASYQWEEVKKVYGDTEIFDLTSGTVVLMPYTAAFSHRNESVSLSFSYKFL